MVASAAIFAALATTTSLAGASPAAAHPLGPPQTLHLAAQGSRVDLTWHAAVDDLVALGLEIGVLGEARTFVYDQGVLVAEESDPSEAALLAEAPELRDYLLSHIVVRQNGTVCTGRVIVTDRLVEDGARLRYDCPDPIDTIVVETSTLTDVHPAYRTLATSVDAQRAVYTADHREQAWDLSNGAEGGSAFRADALPLSAAGVAAVLAAVLAAGAAWRRRHRRGGQRTAGGEARR